MKMKLFFVLWMNIFAIVLSAKPIEPILVTDQNIHINGEQRFFFAFEAGDHIVVDIDVTKGKSLKEFEVLLYAGVSKFQTLKVESLKGKMIRVHKRGVYEFRLKSGGAKKVHFKIKRIPYSIARAGFNTNVEWKTVKDTIRKGYNEQVKVVYDTSYTTKYKRVLKRIDTSYISVADQQERVHSRTNLTNDNVNTLTFNLPKNAKEKLFEKKVIAWSYWVGVGQEGTENYTAELKKFLRTVASKVMLKNLMAGIAIGAYSVAVNPPQGENIHYHLSLITPKYTTQIAKGNVTSAFGRASNHLQGTAQITLTNDNILNGLNVHIKILAIVQRRYYELQGYQVRKVVPLEIKDTKGRVIIREKEIPVIRS